MPVRAAILILAFLLAACGDRQARAPFTDSRIPPGLAQADWPPEGWTWGLIQAGAAPPQRYGLAGPDAVPRGQVLILPGYGQAAEDHYRLARALLDHGFVVWVLDGAGQGGSGRVIGARDLGHLDSFDGDLATLAAMTQSVMPSDAPGPVILVAETTAADLALRRLQLGAPIAGLVLLAPSRTPPTSGAAPASWIRTWAPRLLLGRVRVFGEQGWSSARPEIAAGLAPATHRAWRAANPDLRMGGPSYGWVAADQALQAKVDAGGLRQIRAASLILGPPDDQGGESDLRDRLCRALPRCVQSPFTGQDDADRRIVSFVETLTVQAETTPKPHTLSKAAGGG